MTFRDWFDYSIENRCQRCKQIIKPHYVGLINMGKFAHDRECPIKYNIQSCKYCGKDLE